MPSEVFRFVNLRAPRRTGREADDLGAVVLYSRERSPFFEDLLRLRRDGRPRADFETRARALIASQEYPVRTAPPLAIHQLESWLADQQEQLPAADVAEAVNRITGAPLSTLLSSGDYHMTRLRIADGVLAQSIAPSSAEEKSRLTRWMRIVGFLEKVHAAPEHLFEKQSVLRAPVLLPAELFPLPSEEDPQREAIARAVEERRKAREQAEAMATELSERIASHRRAFDELTSALAADTNDLRRNPAAPAPAASRPPAARESAAREGEASRTPRPPVGATSGAAPLRPAVLSDARTSALTPGTRSALNDLGIGTDFIDVSFASSVLENEIARNATLLFRGQGPRNVARVGDRWVPVAHTDGMVIAPPRGWREPGPCHPSAVDAPGSEVPTVPATALNDIRPIGIADLLQVRQTVKRYALGEVAHVENVMIGESRGRTHRETTRVTETVTIETERSKEESRDLQTAERFELQQETSAVLREESSREVSLSLSVSYGPVAEGTANISVGHSESAEESRKNAVRYSREVTDKAVRKVQERVLERRTVTTEKEWEETNRHDFNNEKGTAHIQGVYRWLDKIYEAQVVSYGLRMMFELVVPEPAAFYRHSLTVMPTEGLKLEMPDQPGSCHHPGGTFVPLLPTDLDATNYHFWVSKYGVTGVQPPPPIHTTIGVCIAQQADDDELVMTLANTELQVPAGYRAERGWVGGEAFLYIKANDDKVEPFMTFQVGRTRLPINWSGAMNGEDGIIPVAGHGYKVAGVAVAVEILCTRTREAFEAWQLATFNAIMSAYNDLKSQYNTALARLQADIQAGIAIGGRNPALNREIERTELKRACLSLLTAQHFDDFDSMRRGTPPHGYPQMNLADAKAEGNYIRFFEQSFEWGNISCRFYPYFWGRKSEWPARLQLDDTDPLFGRFLQAGAARVQIPVRPGFEEAVLYFLQTGNKPWEEEDTSYSIGGSLYLSLIDEIIEETRGAFTRGQGTITVQHDDRTVTGTDTAFDEKLHTDRDIIISERTYKVQRVVSPTQLLLERPYRDSSASGLSYAFGAKLIGDPWEVRVPTNLVFLQADNALPNLADN